MDDKGIVILDSSKVPTSAMKQSAPPSIQTGIQKQDWVGIYVNHRSQRIHTVLTDCFTGLGGFNWSIENDSQYCYLTPFDSELQYQTRVSCSEYINYMRRFINSRVDPVFTSTISRTVEVNGEETGNDHGFVKWLGAVDGINKNYDSYQRTFARYCLLNDVAYAIMDKRRDGKIVMSYRRAIDVMGEPTTDEETNELIGITFYDSKKFIEGSWWLYASRYEMKDGVCVRSALKCKESYGMNTLENEWEVISETPTGSPKMLVFPCVIGDHDTGDYLPKDPKAYDIARLSIKLYNSWSNLFWLLILQGHSTLYVYGKISGLAASQAIINMGINADGSTAPPPDWISPDSDLISVHISAIDRILMEMRDIMREFGVSGVERGTSQSQSGESKSYDFQATNNALMATINQILVPLDNWVTDTYMMLSAGVEQGKYQPSFMYPTTFFPEPEETIEELLEVLNASKTDKLKQLSIEVYKKIARKVLKDDTTRETMQEIMDEAVQAIEGVINDDSNDVEDTDDEA